MFARRHWIPPAALIYAQLAHGLSWGIVLWTAWSGAFGNALYGFAWIHTVALGWITMAALAVLLHAIPNFVDVEGGVKPPRAGRWRHTVPASRSWFSDFSEIPA